MKDRIPLYPGRVKLNPVTGQENTYDMVRADEPTQEGTPLNKASLLQDETAALYGQGADAVPDDILSILSNAVLSIDGSLQDIGGNKVGPRIATGSYAGTGTYGASKPCSLTFNFQPRFFSVYAKHYNGSTKESKSLLFILPWLDKANERKSTVAYDLSTSSLVLSTIYVTYSGNTLSWYAKSDYGSQLNDPYYTYYWYAIG